MSFCRSSLLVNAAKTAHLQSSKELLLVQVIAAVI
jgi:hypothetical protein